ncbi:MAG: baseplate J/gp47 family protein [Planctomycetes bacterium]|nr:baseplate J/gp47 family protein [Planctomycetota bacterium]
MITSKGITHAHSFASQGGTDFEDDDAVHERILMNLRTQVKAGPKSILMMPTMSRRAKWTSAPV